MKRFGILGLCFVAVFATTAVATATEELPELGRCVKLAGATHKYTDAVCTVKSTGENTGQYEWEPGPGTKAAFSTTDEASTLETVGKVTLKCKAGTAKGQFTGPKTDTVTITFTGCVYGTSEFTCHSSGAKEGEVVTNKLEGRLGFISGGGTGKPTVGTRLAPASGTQFASVECMGSTITLTGSVIAAVTADIDKMVLNSTLKFTQSGGKQNPEQFEGGATSVLKAKSSTEEQAGLATKESNTNEELLEVKAVS
jgi:hypothetical protein